MFDDIYALAGICEFMDRRVKTYSSGMDVRLAFAVAINATPEILVVDEALSVGDAAFQRKCFARIYQIRNAGATVLLVSHSAGTLRSLFHPPVLPVHCELLIWGPPHHIVSLYQQSLSPPAQSL